MGKKRINVMVTAFRDGFQSAFGARVLTKDFLPAVEASVSAGVKHFEAGGGARFQSLFFYCNENAFDMMDSFRKTAGPDVNLQTLARGINVVGLESQSRDVIKMHADLFKKHSITTIRNFDALNDVNNLIYSGQCIVDANLKHEICVTMMELPPGCEGAHTPEFYMNRLRKILDAGVPFDSICFKDASGTSVPQKVYDTIKQARQMVPEGTKLVFHSHETAGICVNQYRAAIDAGADQVDLSMAPCSGGTCQSDIMTMWHALRGTDYDLGIDPIKMMEAEEVFKDCMKDYFVPPEAKAVEPMIPFSPMPGGALTANTQMLRDNNLMDRYPEIIRAMGEVVAKGGFGTSVTPVSQFYFQQAFSNVMQGPWKKITDGYGKMVLGYFGKTPTAPDPEIVKLASEQLGKEPTERDPVDINDEDPTKGRDTAVKLLKDNDISDLSEENIFIAATCKDKGIAYLKGEAELGIRKNAKKQAGTTSGDGGDGAYTVTVDNNPFNVQVSGNSATVNGKTYSVDVQSGAAKADAAKTPGGGIEVKAPMAGQVVKLVASPNQTVKEGDVLLILEAMKMETEIQAPGGGTVSSINVKKGDRVSAEQSLVVLS